MSSSIGLPRYTVAFRKKPVRSESLSETPVNIATGALSSTYSTSDEARDIMGALSLTSRTSTFTIATDERESGSPRSLASTMRTYDVVVSASRLDASCSTPSIGSMEKVSPPSDSRVYRTSPLVPASSSKASSVKSSVPTTVLSETLTAYSGLENCGVKSFTSSTVI